jgi:hypothetical protein
MSRTAWVTAFLSGTALILTAELWASFDDDPNTDPWTDLIVAYVPAEITFAAIGALALWLPIHFAIRYKRRRDSTRSDVTNNQPRGDDDV